MQLMEYTFAIIMSFTIVINSSISTKIAGIFVVGNLHNQQINPHSISIKILT
jgi:hypothetical protein